MGSAPADNAARPLHDPPDLARGVYAIAARHDGGVDRTLRSVYVRKNFPEYYVIAHLGDTHIGKDKRHPRTSDAINSDLIQTVNKSDASIAVIVGDLTETGAQPEFQRFLRILDTCTLPTFVCAGNHDRQALNYEAFFGPLTYTFRFGRDGYLVFDSKDLVTADELGEQDGLLQRYRRELKACRWCVGLTHRYEPMMGMRSQLTLFVDDPLDFLLFGHWHRENTAEEPCVPWGTTPISVVPAAINGALRLIDVTSAGLLPRPVAYGAEVAK